MKKISILDGIRGIASLLVLWAHFPTIDGGPIFKYLKLAANGFYVGYVGVDIFFALSGFLITRLLIQEKKSKGYIDFKIFYLKRALRIFPVYYLTILLVGVLISWDKTLWSAIYLSNYYFSFYHLPNALRHVWSLCVEEHYYIFWPLILSVFSLVQSKWIIKYIIPILAVLSGLLALFVLEPKSGVGFINKATNVRILTIVFGSILAFYERKIKDYDSNFLFGLTLVCFTAMCCSRFFTDIELLAFNRYITSASFSIFFLMLILNLSYKNTKRTLLSLIDNSFFIFFGKISYGLYLFHQPILYYYGVSHLNDVHSVSIKDGLYLLILCISIPTLSYYYFELPFLRLKSRFSKKHASF